MLARADTSFTEHGLEHRHATGHRSCIRTPGVTNTLGRRIRRTCVPGENPHVRRLSYSSGRNAFGYVVTLISHLGFVASSNTGSSFIRAEPVALHAGQRLDFLLRHSIPGFLVLLRKMCSPQPAIRCPDKCEPGHIASGGS